MVRSTGKTFFCVFASLLQSTQIPEINEHLQRIYFFSISFLRLAQKLNNNVNFSCPLITSSHTCILQDLLSCWQRDSSRLEKRFFSFRKGVITVLIRLWDTKNSWDHHLYPYVAAIALARSLCLFICLLSYFFETFRPCAAGRWLKQCKEGPRGSGFCSLSTHGKKTWHRCWQSWVNLLSEEMETRWEPPKRAKECFQTVRWSSLLAPSTWGTWQPPLLQLARILESAKLKAELLNYWEKTDHCMHL